ncbi:MAG: phage holin family protein [Actinobacteria bacterium]|nr:phage holin family protein [Actinomycetota bacterium]
MRLILRWIALALAIWAATAIVPGITVNGGARTYLWVALLFGLINAVLGSMVKVVTFPLSIVTFGLFIFLVNVAMLALTARWSTALDIKDFWTAVFASLIISIVSSLLKGFYRRPFQF